MRPGPGGARLAIGIALAVVLTAWVARVYDGRRSLEACDAALARGDRVEAIVFARAAAEARCPWCGSSELGYSRLSVIAKDAEDRGDDASAVAAWRAVRAATLASIVIHRAPPRRERADTEIARLEHRMAAAGAAATGGFVSPAATEERLGAALAVSSLPSASVFLSLTVGGALFLFGAARFVFTRARRPRVEDVLAACAGGAIAVGVALLS